MCIPASIADLFSVGLRFMTVILLAGPFSAMTGTQLVMLIFAVIFLTLILLSTGRRIRESRALTGRPARERYADLEARQSSRRDVEHVLIELDKVARQVHAQIDTKLLRLEMLIRDADKRIVELSTLNQDRESPAAFEVTLDEETPVAESGDAVEPAGDRFESIYRLADKGLTAGQIAKKVNRLQGEVELILGLRNARTGTAGVASPQSK